MGAGRSIVHQAAVGAAMAQIGVLGAWSTASVWPAAIALAAALVALWPGPHGTPTSYQDDPAVRPWARSLAGPQLALGGLGMLLGAWADAHFHVPPCLCCRWRPGTGALTMLQDALWTWSSLGMWLGCMAAVFGAPLAIRKASTPTRMLTCGAQSIGMWLGMGLVMQPTSEALRRLPMGKLALGHLGMLLGMGLGAAICSRMSRLLPGGQS